MIAANSRQPELSKPIGDYIKGVVSDSRIAEGRARVEASPWLAGVSAQYGVQAEFLVGIGIESSDGRIQGDMDVIRSLSTLAAEGRRKDWAEGQLLSALRILFTAQASREQLKGSWAGAMGQTQFTPQDYLAFAVDADGDGKRDIWGSANDALASTANFLQRKAAWRRGEPCTREVILPTDFDYSLAEGAKQLPQAWRALGVRDATPYRAAVDEPAMLLLPSGWTGPAFLALPNHFAIRAYNNSTSYALAVDLLGQRIAGDPPPVRAWPVDLPTNRADRIAARRCRRGAGPEDPPGRPRLAEEPRPASGRLSQLRPDPAAEERGRHLRRHPPAPAAAHDGAHDDGARAALRRGQPPQPRLEQIGPML